jgi:hypothetical protein
MTAEAREPIASRELESSRTSRPRLEAVALSTDPLELVALLEEAVFSSRRLPLTSTILVDGDLCQDSIDELRAILPRAIRAASEVIARQDQLLADARREAAELLAEAEEHHRWQLDPRVIERAAHKRADQLLDKAARRAEQVLREADEYAEQVYSSLQATLRQFDREIAAALDGVESGEHQPGDLKRRQAPDLRDPDADHWRARLSQ